MTREEMYAKIEQHAEHLASVFPSATKSGVELCKALFRLENKMHNMATDSCNGIINDTVYDKAEAAALRQVNNLLKPGTIKIFVNGDPRGFALKINYEQSVEMRDIPFYRDFGGYMIIAPKFSE